MPSAFASLVTAAMPRDGPTGWTALVLAAGERNTHIGSRIQGQLLRRDGSVADDVSVRVRALLRRRCASLTPVVADRCRR
jgi:hypothetical protein